MSRLLSRTFALALASAVFAIPAAASGDQSELAEGFKSPPSDARPRVWWHWMNGNITKEGIKADLDWMKRIGIGGVQTFDVNLKTPKVVERRLVYMTPEWKDAFKFAVRSADELGLDFAIASSPGWSETGGPWVKPEDGIKKIAWSEVVITGGHPFRGVLPKPISQPGPFQDIEPSDPLAVYTGGKLYQAPQIYSDTQVVAYRVSRDATAIAKPRLFLADGMSLDEAALSDGRATTAIDIPRGSPEAPTWIGMEFSKPTKVRTLQLYFPGAASMLAPAAIQPRLEAQDRNGRWKKVADVNLSPVPTTVSFPAVTARHFRLVMLASPNSRYASSTPAKGSVYEAPPPAPSATSKLAELRLMAESRLNQWEAKAGFALANDYEALDDGLDPQEAGLKPSDVLLLTDHMRPDGTLDWTPPKGLWRVVRMGWSLTGKTNHPATEEATGLEVDKLDASAVRRYMETYLGTYRDAVGDELIGKRGIRTFLTDSTEAGAFNWSEGLLNAFHERRGYDALPWLPTLTGAIVQDRARSNAFLFDFRKTIGELHASEHYGTVATVAHENGLKVYGEAMEYLRNTLGDDMDMRSHADVPMAALWTYPQGGHPRSSTIADIRGAASIAHLDGKKVVAAESMTSSRQPWAYAPADLRRFVDTEFAAGVNQIVIHSSVHQPIEKKPGLSLLSFGQFFNRHESWAEMARPWIDYIARSSYLLQQGRFHADIAYFYGEDATAVGQTSFGSLPDVPHRYAYDYVNERALKDLLSVQGGELVSQGGARYKVLFLGKGAKTMTLATLRRIAALAQAGATVIGTAPTGSFSLNDDAPAFRSLVHRLWQGSAETAVGAGRIIATDDVEAGLARIKITPDFDVGPDLAANDLSFVHRTTNEADIYFVRNGQDRDVKLSAKFRVTGKRPQIWRADSGAIMTPRSNDDGISTTITLPLAAEESAFVIFGDPAGEVREASLEDVREKATLNGDWLVSFEPRHNGPAAQKFDRLSSLSLSSDPAIKYFSGIATYRKSLRLTRADIDGKAMLLDLGVVGDLAEVFINGVSAGTVWHAPFLLDISKFVRAGNNALEIRVANLWVNRLIGDAQPGAAPIAFTTIPTYRADAPLRPSGLIGPVRILTRTSDIEEATAR